MNKQLQVLTLIAAVVFSGAANVAPITIFTTNFDGTIPAEISPGTATLS